MAVKNHSGSSFSVLGADLAVTGDIVAENDLHIDGKIEGDVRCTALVQGESSTIRGAIRAASARLSGTVHGTIDATDLVIHRSARIHGDVTYDSLTIEQGAEVDGRFCRRTSGAEVSVEDGTARLMLAQ